jgi:DNA ligase (NAD+)
MPISLGGSTIGKMTLHNATILKNLDVAINDVVLIEKAGDIIPQVVRVIEKSSSRVTIIYPTKCPECGGVVSWDVRNVSLWCKNSNCPAQFIEQVIHYVKTLDLLGVGESIISGLCERGFVKKFSDLYDLQINQIKEITGGDKSAEKVYDAIWSKEQIPLEIFLDSLGIDGLGTSTSKNLAKKFKTLKAIRSIGKGDLLSMEGIQSLTESKIINGLADMSFDIDELLKKIIVEEVKETMGSLTGKSFCLTGAMSMPRKEIEKLIEAAGGTFESGVKSGLTYLVQADPESTSSKSEKANKLGVKILAEADLWKMLNSK